MTSRSLAFVRHTILLLPLGASSFLEHHSHYYELGKNSTSDILDAGAVTYRPFSSQSWNVFWEFSVYMTISLGRLIISTVTQLGHSARLRHVGLEKPNLLYLYMCRQGR